LNRKKKKNETSQEIGLLKGFSLDQEKKKTEVSQETVNLFKI